MDKNMSRNGLMSLIIWCVKSVSEMASPARKAPMASDNPNACVSQATPSVITIEVMTKTSLIRMLARRSSTKGIM